MFEIAIEQCSKLVMLISVASMIGSSMSSSGSFPATPASAAEIPLITVEPGVEPALASLVAQPERFELLLACARRAYTPIGVRLADELSRNWASRNQSALSRRPKDDPAAHASAAPRLRRRQNLR
jgi:hypothetical protein